MSKAIGGKKRSFTSDERAAEDARRKIQTSEVRPIPARLWHAYTVVQGDMPEFRRVVCFAGGPCARQEAW